MDYLRKQKERNARGNKKENIEVYDERTGTGIERDEVPKLVKEKIDVMGDDEIVFRKILQQANNEEASRAENPIFVGEDETVMDDKEVVLREKRQFNEVSRAEDPIFVRKDEDVKEDVYIIELQDQKIKTLVKKLIDTRFIQRSSKKYSEEFKAVNGKRK